MQATLRHCYYHFTAVPTGIQVGRQVVRRYDERDVLYYFDAVRILMRTTTTTTETKQKYRYCLKGKILL